MNPDNLESFLAISKYKSLSQAAQSLYITQPTLSNRMKNLENYLNLQLFERSWKGVELTRHGLLFLPQALKMLDKLEDFKSLSTNFKDIDNNPYLMSVNETNELFKIGMNNYLVPKYSGLIIQSLAKKFPDTKFQITTASTSDLLKQRYYGTLDYIIYYDFDARLPNTELIKHEEMIVILDEEDYHLVNHDIKTLQTLGKPLYLNSNPALDQYLPYFRPFRDFLHIDHIVLIESIALIKTLIKEKQGFSILPESVYNADFKNENLYKLHIPDSITKLPIYSTYNMDKDTVATYATYLNNALKEKKPIF